MSEVVLRYELANLQAYLSDFERRVMKLEEKATRSNPKGSPDSPFAGQYVPPVGFVPQSPPVARAVEVKRGDITPEELDAAVLKFFGNREGGTFGDRCGFRNVLEDFARARGIL